MNMVERWFSALTTKKLQRSAHRSVKELAADIKSWAAAWNEDPKPGRRRAGRRRRDERHDTHGKGQATGSKCRKHFSPPFRCWQGDETAATRPPSLVYNRPGPATGLEDVFAGI
jgi:hypothetical protein